MILAVINRVNKINHAEPRKPERRHKTSCLGDIEEKKGKLVQELFSVRKLNMFYISWLSSVKVETADLININLP